MVPREVGVTTGTGVGGMPAESSSLLGQQVRNAAMASSRFENASRLDSSSQSVVTKGVNNMATTAATDTEPEEVQQQEGASDWRIMGQWSGSREVFLICMGLTADECKSHLREALSGYTAADLRRIRSAWLERFCRDDWRHHDEISLTPIRRRRGNLAWRAKKKQMAKWIKKGPSRG